MKDIFTKSIFMSREYCCSVVRIGDVVPVEGSDFLGKTIVDGFQIVVRKDKVKKGDIMFYVSNECELNERFLSVNNEFEKSCYTKNSNFEETETHVKEIENIRKSLEDNDLDQDTIDSKKALIAMHENAIKGLCGFFNKYGRVRMINLRKCPSLGYLFPPEALYKFCPKAESVNLSDWVDDVEADHDFDTVNGELFVKAFIPRQTKPVITSSRFNKRQKRVDKMEKILPNEFFFHYDTDLLVVEDLSIKDMRREKSRNPQTRGFNSKLSIIQPYAQVQILKQRANRLGKTLVLVDSYKTTQVEYGTLHVYKPLLSERQWVSEYSGELIDRDLNASRNILEWGLKPSKHYKLVDYPKINKKCLVVTN